MAQKGTYFIHCRESKRSRDLLLSIDIDIHKALTKGPLPWHMNNSYVVLVKQEKIMKSLLRAVKLLYETI